MHITVHEIKAVAEFGGATMSTAALFLTGAGKKSGPWIGMAAAVPWIAFAIATTSWLMVAQSLITVGVHLINLRRKNLAGLRLEYA